MEITPQLWMIDGLGQCYLYKDADSFTLIDAGIKGDAERILDELVSAGGKPEQLRQIVLTHSHPDHIGGVAGLVERTGAKVLAHELDCPAITGETGVELPSGLPDQEREFIIEAIRNIPLASPVNVDRVLQDGDEIDLGSGGRVVHVPGHTPGSIAIYLSNEKLIFTGDAAERSREEDLILGMFNLDRPRAIESLKKLTELDFEIACLGHGAPEGKGARQAFGRLAETLAEE